MPIKRKEEFKGVLVEDLDSSVEQGDCEQLPIGAEAHRQDLVRHLERTRMCERQMATAMLLEEYIYNSSHLHSQRTTAHLPLLPPLKLPKLHLLVRTPADKHFVVLPHMQRPHRAGVRLDGVDESGRCNVVYQDLAGLCADGEVSVAGEEGAADGITAVHGADAGGGLHVPDFDGA